MRSCRLRGGIRTEAIGVLQQRHGAVQHARGEREARLDLIGADAFFLRLEFGARVVGVARAIAGAIAESLARVDKAHAADFEANRKRFVEQLDRKIAERRLFPAVDIGKSGTRREELLLDQAELNRVYLLRNFLADMPAEEAMAFLIQRMQRTKTNKEFFQSMMEG